MSTVRFEERGSGRLSRSCAYPIAPIDSGGALLFAFDHLFLEDGAGLASSFTGAGDAGETRRMELVPSA